MRGSRASALAVVLTFATSAAFGFTSSGCDKLGLGGKSDGGTTTGSTGGGLFSFLDKNFEGEVTMQVSGKGLSAGNPSAASAAAANKPKTILFGMKSPKVRIDAGADIGEGNPMLAQGAAFIVDPPAKKAYALIISQKKAIVLDFDKAKGGIKVPKLGPPSAPSAPTGPPPDPPKIEKTGKTDTVAGYQCEIWKITSKTTHAEACLAEGIKWIDLSDIGVQSPEFTAVAAVSDFNHFPLRMVAYDEKNVETSRMEATKIEKKSLDDAHFAVPADYQVVDIAAMLGAMGGFGGAPGAGGPPGANGLPPGFPAGAIPPGGFPPGHRPPGLPPGFPTAAPPKAH